MSEKYYDIRERYLNLSIDGECVWVKKLRRILNSDIHEKPLGCKISNTHIKISKVHLDTFYEAQLLFSHAHWVQRFANELCNKIIGDKESLEHSDAKRIVLVGYETYIEPVMYLLKNVIKEKLTDYNVEYCIYEEAKYTYLQHIKDPEIRYIENAFKKDATEEELKGTQIVFICGISTTLRTYESMRSQFLKDLENKIDERGKWTELLSTYKYFSIIQVLPDNLEEKMGSGDCKFVIEYKDDYEEGIEWVENEKRVKRYTWSKTNGEDSNKKFIDVPYVVDVKCEWYKATECKMCYPQNVMDEKPIIATSETSVVPIQRILLNKENKDNRRKKYKGKDNFNNDYSIDFFKKDKDGNFVFRNYLYYGHTVRGEHHFLYYIRTNHLFADILSENIQKYTDDSGNESNALNEFKTYCEKAWDNIKERIKLECDLDDAVHIIVSPSHFSSKMFCNAINQHVFKFKAHVISFDPQKEYRSSFETKYSNYAYFLEQIKEMYEDSKGSKKKLYFYFVDDQIITGSNFYRMTSLIKNLFVQSESDIGNKRNNKKCVKNSVKQPENIKIWNGVFIVVSRNSTSTKKDYVENTSAYYPLFNIAVPSVRSHADSCPMCKMRTDAENNVKKSVLDCNAHHWMEKVNWHKLHNLADAKKKNEAIKDELTKEKLKDRHFRRFYCENELQKILSGRGNGENIHNILVDGIEKILSENCNEQCEYLISCIKALSRPFIYYREDVKPVSLNILIGLTQGLLNNKNLLSGSYKWGCQNIPLYDNRINVKFNDKYEVYILLEILINCLTSIDSTYLLHYNRNGKDINEVCKIAELHDFVEKILGDEKGKVLTFKPKALGAGIEKHGFYMVVLNAVKRIILGISGNSKSEKIEQILLDLEKNPEVKKFVKTYGKGKNSIYDFSLVQAIFLENSVQCLDIIKDIKTFYKDKKNQDIDIVKEPITSKYETIGGFLTEVVCSDVNTSMQFLYYDEEMQWGEDFSVFVINKDAQRRSVIELLMKENQKESGKKSETIRKGLSTIGFYSSDNKFLIKLHGYVENDIEQKNEEKPEKEVYLLIDFGNAVQRIKEQLTYVIGILKYRDSLTNIIRNDLDSGAIKSAVQAAGTRMHLDTQQVTDHGGVADWQTLIFSIYKDLNSQKLEIRKNGYEILNVLMNEIISLGASREILYKYFGPGNSANGDLFEVVAGKRNKCQSKKDLVEQYFKDRKEAVKIFIKPGEKYSYEIESISYEDYKCGRFNIYPSLFHVDSSPEDNDGLYQVFLIGLIDILIRNAIKHGKKYNGKVAIKIVIEGAPESYSIAIINEREDFEIDAGGLRQLYGFVKEEETDIFGVRGTGGKATATPLQIGGFTTSYLTGVLPRIRDESSSENRLYYSVKMGKDEDKNYKSIIYVNKEEK